MFIRKWHIANIHERTFIARSHHKFYDFHVCIIHFDLLNDPVCACSPPPWMFLTQKLFGPQKFITNLLIRVFIRTSDDPLDFTVVLWESPVVGDCGKTFTGFISYST